MTRQDKTRQDNGCLKNNKCQVKFVGSLTNHGPNFAGAIFLISGSSPTLTTMQGGGRQPHIIVKDINE